MSTGYGGRADLDAIAVPKRAMSFEGIEAAVERAVAAAPPLTDDQVRRITSLLGGVS